MSRDLLLSALAIYTAANDKARKIYGTRCTEDFMVPCVSYDEVKCKRVYFQSFDVITLSEHGIITRCYDGINLRPSFATMTPSEFISLLKNH